MRRPSRRVAAAVAALAALAVAVALLAPGGGSKVSYAQFEHCPLQDPATRLCLFTQTAGGEFVAGARARAVALSRTITLQGGVHVVENSEKEIVHETLIAAQDGETLSRTPQIVPGGLQEVVDPRLLAPTSRALYEKLVRQGATAVTATIELVGPASSIHINVQNLIEGRGTALTLPVRVRLANAFLGRSCYIGSIRRPISLPLTTGTTNPPRPNRPIRGRVGRAKFEGEYNLTIVRGTSLVNDSFAGPAAKGCRAPQVDRAVNAALGLPAPAGRNTAILTGTLQDANAPAVRASQ